MANLRNFLLGMDILKNHYADPDGYHLGAEHDEIFAFNPEHELNSAEIAAMKELGWRQGEYSWEFFV
jgi:hypothetical protein